MEIEIAITKEIINESLPLHYRHAPFQQRYLPFFYPALLFVMGTFQSLTSKEEGFFRWFSMILFVIIGTVSALWINYRRNNNGKRMLKLYGDNTHYKVLANEDGMVFHLSYTTSENKWPAYPRAVIGKEMVLVYQQNSAYIIFHHTFFANDDFGEFKQLVRNHIHVVTED